MAVEMNIRASYDSFRALREDNSYYIDKTGMLEEYLVKRFDKAVLFARPRRFGKTMTMTMFRDFLDIRQDSREIFKGLKVMDRPEVVKNYMNQYPVVFISLKEVFGDGFEKIFENFKITISNMCLAFRELLESDKVQEEDKIQCLKIRRQEAGEGNSIAVLGLLSRMLHDHYGKPAFVIVDEYDVPMAKALGTPSYDKVRNMIEHMLSYVCKTNDDVKAVLLSGCLYTVKNSTYTGVNNIEPYTVLSPVFASAIGFTDKEVRKLLADAGLTDWYDTVAEWYDGYVFGRDKMYCPWDVLKFVRSLLDGSYSSAMGPKSYWVNTSETAQNLIHGFLGKTPGASESFERLLAGKSIQCMVNEHVPYHLIHANGDNLWSALLETGYLTKAVTEEMPAMPLRIPNREIQAVFREEVWNYFKDKVDNVFVRDFVNALWAREIKTAEAALNQILEATLSFYHEYHEYSYHLILDGFFTGIGYRVQSEREAGYGRSDLVILHPARQKSMVLELKHVKEKEEMEAALEEASSQLILKKYDSQLVYDGYTERLKYGMAFCGKQVMIGVLA
ncbi:MAG: AAA family ATPase [Lachnospiraceae bacterium]|nr:AAA family ATPase [Lachnospiraceae bacterium]